VSVSFGFGRGGWWAGVIGRVGLLRSVCALGDGTSWVDGLQWDGMGWTNEARG
jgi:hypothetical protein